MNKDSYHTDVPVDRCYPLIGFGFQQLACYDLLYCQNYAVFASYTDTSTPIFNGFNCVFDLEASLLSLIHGAIDQAHLKIPAVGRKDGILEIVARSNRGLEYVN